MTQDLLYKHSSDERAVLFFRHIKKELGITSTLQTVALVARIMTHVIKGIPVRQAAQLLNRLPNLFQMLLLKAWRRKAGDQKPYAHLDELVDSLYDEDRLSAHSLFSSEVEALNTVVITLRRLDTYLGLFNFNVLKDSWIQTLKQVPLEDAA